MDYKQGALNARKFIIPKGWKGQGKKLTHLLNKISSGKSNPNGLKGRKHSGVVDFVRSFSISTNLSLIKNLSMIVLIAENIREVMNIRSF